MGNYMKQQPTIYRYFIGINWMKTLFYIGIIGFFLFSGMNEAIGCGDHEPEKANAEVVKNEAETKLPARNTEKPMAMSASECCNNTGCELDPTKEHETDDCCNDCSCKVHSAHGFSVLSNGVNLGQAIDGSNLVIRVFLLHDQLFYDPTFQPPRFDELA